MDSWAGDLPAPTGADFWFIVTNSYDMSEVIIYDYLNGNESTTFDVSSWLAQVSEHKKSSSKISTVFLSLSIISALIGVTLTLFFCASGVLAWGQGLAGKINENLGISTAEVQNLKNGINTQKSDYEPTFDAKLPVVNHLVIPSIGVNTDIQEASLNDYEDALKKGVWRVSDFGAPDNTGEPIILAAHRFGYLVWTDLFRRENSFYNLPKVKIGDVIEIDWKQRKYLYEVYATNKGTEITDYSADLILYTCESLIGPERIFVYAHLVQI